MNRARIEIICVTLKAISSGASNKTKISYTARVSYRQVNDSLKVLLDKGLLEVMDKWYLVTSKGLELIKAYEVIKDVFE